MTDTQNPTFAALSALTSWWKGTSDEIPKPQRDAAAVGDIERRYDVKLPEDFYLYLSTIAPAELFLDDEWSTWWAPTKIKSISEAYRPAIHNPIIAQAPQTYLFFADFMIWSSAWAICCNEGPDRGRIVSINGLDDAFVASSFTTFINAYLADPLGMQFAPFPA